MYDDYQCLRVNVDKGVARVTIDHPPINLLNLALIQELDRLGSELEADKDIRVAVFNSANPDFFIAHADLELISLLPTEAPPKATTLGWFHTIVERYRTMAKVTIGVIEGRARGGGSEFLLSLDMRFAAIGEAILGQPEVALGIMPGGGATQRLPRLIGRARAAEIVLGCADFDAAAAERYGWVNRALPPADLAPFVNGLATRIASFPAEALALAKASLNAADETITAGLIEEAHYFALTLELNEARRRMKRALELGAQTREGELDLEAMYDDLRGP